MSRDNLETLNVGDEAVIANYHGYGLPHYTRVIVKRKTKTQIIVGYAHNTQAERKFRFDGSEVGERYRSEKLTPITQTVLDNEARRELERLAYPVMERLTQKIRNVRWLSKEQIDKLTALTNELFPEEKKEDQIVNQ